MRDRCPNQRCLGTPPATSTRTQRSSSPSGLTGGAAIGPPGRNNTLASSSPCCCCTRPPSCAASSAHGLPCLTDQAHGPHCGPAGGPSGQQPRRFRSPACAHVSGGCRRDHRARQQRTAANEKSQPHSYVSNPNRHIPTERYAEPPPIHQRWSARQQHRPIPSINHSRITPTWWRPRIIAPRQYHSRQ